MSASSQPWLESTPFRSRIRRTTAGLDFVKRVVARGGAVSDLDAARLRREGWQDDEIRAIVEQTVVVEILVLEGDVAGGTGILGAFLTFDVRRKTDVNMRIIAGTEQRAALVAGTGMLVTA